jgi:hypothetical protein
MAQKLNLGTTVSLVLILLATVVSYWPALNGGFVWDDDAYVPKPAMQSIDGLRRIWLEPGATLQYYPLLYSSFWIQHRVWGDATTGYHAVSLILHLAAVILVFLILRALEIPGALLAAGIFAVHPVHVESVAWISEQKNTMSGALYLAAVLAYLRVDASRVEAGKPSPWRPYLLSLAFFVLSLLTKTVTATLPTALLVVFWWKRGTLNRRDVLPLVPFFVAGISAGLFSAYAERFLVGATGADYELSVVQRCLLAGRVIWFYLYKLIWPVNLSFSYRKWEIDPANWSDWLYLTGVVAVALVLWKARHRSRAPLAGFLFFVGTLFPVLGFLNVYPFVYSYVADHFQYLASLGVITLGASALSVAWERSVLVKLISGTERIHEP